MQHSQQRFIGRRGCFDEPRRAVRAAPVHADGYQAPGRPGGLGINHTGGCFGCFGRFGCFGYFGYFGVSNDDGARTASASVTLTNLTAPVPGPGSNALLLGGPGLVGLAALRRRR